MDQLMPEPDGNGSFRVTLVAVAPVALDTVTVKPTWLPAVTWEASAFLVIESLGGVGTVTTMVAEALTLGALVADAVAVFFNVWLQVELVPLLMWTETLVPAARLPKLQFKTCEPTDPVIEQVPGPE